MIINYFLVYYYIDECVELLEWDTNNRCTPANYLNHYIKCDSLDNIENYLDVYIGWF